MGASIRGKFPQLSAVVTILCVLIKNIYSWHHACNYFERLSLFPGWAGFVAPKLVSGVGQTGVRVGPHFFARRIFSK
jgi:hypothetical protein